MPRIDPATLRLLCELAHDGAWTLAQFEARHGQWDCSRIPSRYIDVASTSLRPTGYSRVSVRVPIVRPKPAAVEIAQAQGIDTTTARIDQLEHVVGLAELRWQSGITAWHSISGDTLVRAQHQRRVSGDHGGFRATPDGAYLFEHGLMLCEYDTGRYSSRQVHEKIAAARSTHHLEGYRIIGHLWGVPTQERANWMRDRGARSVTVVPVSSWLPVVDSLRTERFLDYNGAPRNSDLDPRRPLSVRSRV